jgi:transcriptional regulator with XRE-family HTH domain
MIRRGMDSRDYIIKAFERLMSEKEDTTQKEIADFMGIDPPVLNQFLKKTRNFSEKKREDLANFFNMTYMEMLFLGKDIQTGRTEVPEKFKELDEARMREIAREEANKQAHPPKTNSDIIDFKNPDQVKHHQLLNKFPNTKEALEMNELAVEYAKKDPNAIKELIKYIKYQMSQIKEDGDSLGEASIK